jgi:hypothetical protein
VTSLTTRTVHSYELDHVGIGRIELSITVGNRRPAIGAAEREGAPRDGKRGDNEADR